jgi:2-amino-4-hydroxy-6-hydroxymethyldihydropteridine diphosphokinase
LIDPRTRPIGISMLPPNTGTDLRAGKQIYLSLGSNRGDRIANLQRAMDELGKAGIRVQRVSSFYKTEPVDFGPQAWFLNCAAEALTELMPMQLLKAVKSVERVLGRRPGVHKGPRPIDIDILLYENVVVRSAALTIPHERMNERRFVLIPLRELAPAARHPVYSKTVAELLQDTRDLSQVVRYKPEARR